MVRVPACHAGGRGFNPRRSRQYAGVMELVDMRDLGSRATSVGVRVPTPAPWVDGSP